MCIGGVIGIDIRPSLDRKFDGNIRLIQQDGGITSLGTFYMILGRMLYNRFEPFIQIRQVRTVSPQLIDGVGLIFMNRELSPYIQSLLISKGVRHNIIIAQFLQGQPA